MSSIRKAFFGVEVLHGVDFELKEGEVHALVGENGAGKSTLMKILMGEFLPDCGEIALNGTIMSFKTPRDALNNGISKVHQELSPILDMTVAENIFLGREPNKAGFVLTKKLIDQTTEAALELGLQIDPKKLMRQLSVAETQMVEIMKAVSYGSRILILDEPTSAIALAEAQKLMEIIEVLRKRGVGIIYISHKLDEVFQIADRLTILRDGNFVKCADIEDIQKHELINLMVGRELTDLFPRTENKRGEALLAVKNLSRKNEFEDISFDVHRGEILGLSGLMGSGRTELCMTIFGAKKPDCGRVLISGAEVRIKNPSDAIKNRIALVSEDRKQEGLNLKASVEDNLLSVVQSRYARYGFVRRAICDSYAENMISMFQIKVHSKKQMVSNLSGGNQQKVVIAKWRLTDPEIIIIDEPTRGIDVGAEAEIYRIINEFAQQGKAILMVSSEMPELIGMCDRVLVMRKGKIAGELTKDQITQEEIMRLSAN